MTSRKSFPWAVCRSFERSDDHGYIMLMYMYLYLNDIRYNRPCPTTASKKALSRLFIQLVLFQLIFLFIPPIRIAPLTGMRLRVRTRSISIIITIARLRGVVALTRYWGVRV
jgi:hypothetical protein